MKEMEWLLLSQIRMEYRHVAQLRESLSLEDKCNPEMNHLLTAKYIWSLLIEILGEDEALDLVSKIRDQELHLVRTDYCPLNKPPHH